MWLGSVPAIMASSRVMSEQPSDDPSRLQQVFALAGLLGPILFWGTLLLLDSLRADYSNLTNQVSEIGAIGVQYGSVGQAMFVLHGLLLVAFATGLARDLWGSLAKLGPIVLLLVGTASLAAGIFPLNPADPTASTNIAHGLFILPGTFAAIAAPFLVARRMRFDSRWRDSYYYSTLIAGGLLATILLLPIVFLATNSTPAWFSEIEQLMGRAHHAILNLWVFAVAFRLFRLASIGRSPAKR